MAKPSEDTLTTIFKEILSENGINVEAFPIWKTPVGIRKPDLLCKNDKYYPLEAKIKEQDLIKDIVKIQNDYFTHAKTLNIGGAFVLKHPTPKRLNLKVGGNKLKEKFKRATFRLILMFPEGDERQFEIIKGKFNILIPIILDTINHKRIKKELEPSVAIEILQRSTHYLEEALKNVKMDILITSMGGIEFFEDLMQIDVKKNYTSIRAATSFYILTQLLFYYVVAYHRKEDLKPLNQIKNVKELKDKYFSKILDINYRAIFGVEIVSYLPDSAVEQLNVIISTLKSLRPENVKGDLIGTIFHDLIPLQIRKRVAAYYTNILATEMLANLTIDSPDITVADLASGSGGLLVAAYRRKLVLINQTRKFNQDDHWRFLKEDIFGIDIMPFATNIASCNLGLQSPEFLTDSVNIGIWDSIDLKPGDIIPEFSKLNFLFRTSTIDTWLTDDNDKRRVISDLKSEGEDEGFAIEKRDLILMNPPFTRQERLPIPYKERLKQMFKKHTKSNIYNESMGLHGVFILKGDTFLNDGGKMGLVLPASILARISFDGLRRNFLCKNYCIELVILNTSRLNFSESTLWREILLVIKKEKPKDQITRICRLTEFPDSVANALTIAESIKKALKSKKYQEKQISQKLLEKMDDWSSLTIFSDLFHEIYNFLKDSSLMITFLSRFDCIRSDLGQFKTDSNLSCFIQHESRKGTEQLKENWIGTNLDNRSLTIEHKNRQNVKFKIPVSKIRRAFRTTSNLNIINVDNALGYLLVSSFNKIRENFLRHIFEKKKVAAFKTKEFDKILKRFENRKSHLILNRRLYLASPGTSYVAFCSSTPFIGVDTWQFKNIDYNESKLLSLWLNSTFGIIQLLMIGVAIEGDWMKVHKYMLDRFYIPDSKDFLEHHSEELDLLYNSVSKIKMPSLLEQLRMTHKTRKKIDKFFIEKLNLDIWKKHKSLTNFLTLIQKELLKELKGLCTSDS
ncbi:hypothetical protein LCGC14_1064770 [marine sediment metagenome]|uniref:site-specific DNA-methyltransferase (adenine-specific) n=1 Tax=marine sediment metagenome TaxID=412755 RepID=A0A0F9MPS3_9ZZZZ|nr:SAM-dependent DNA methyltransferase [archaeon]